MPRLCQVIKGVKISQGQKGRVTRPCLLEYTVLRLMKGLWFSSEAKPSYDNLMLWASSISGFSRSGEITTPSENSYDPNVRTSV